MCGLEQVINLLKSQSWMLLVSASQLSLDHTCSLKTVFPPHSVCRVSYVWYSCTQLFFFMHIDILVIHILKNIT